MVNQRIQFRKQAPETEAGDCGIAKLNVNTDHSIGFKWGRPRRGDPDALQRFEFAGSGRMPGSNTVLRSD